MKISKKDGGDFVPHDEGSFRAVCVDVTPLKKQMSKFGEREVFQLVFETSAPPMEDGSPRCVWSRGFTPSLNEKSNFRKFLRQWRGRDLTPAEEVEFDTETLIGVPANLVIVHEHGENDQFFSNIAACTRCLENPLSPSGKFTRKKDKLAAEGEGEKTSYRRASAPEGEKQASEPVDGTQAGADWSKVKVHVGKHAGVELRDLDAEAIEKLVSNWLPKHQATAKPTADDKRLAAALEKAHAAITGATTQPQPQEDF